MATGARDSLIKRVQINVACSNLKRKWDCYVSMHLHGMIGEYDHTECVDSTKTPEFATMFEIDYHFEKEQKLWFRLHDRNSMDSELGLMTCTLAEIMGQPCKSQDLQDSYTKEVVATIHLRAEEVCCTELKEANAQFSADNLDKKDFLGKSDPYLVFSRQNKDGSFSVVHRTEIFKDSLDPVWNGFRITSQQLCNSDPDRVIRISCYDWDFGSSDDFIGQFDTSFAELEATGKMKFESRKWECINTKKQTKKNYKNSGVIRLGYFETSRIYSFRDYVQAGWQLNFSMAIDYTGKACSDPTSFHYLEPEQPNQYAKAVIAVGDICQHYNSAFQQFPAYGCGADAGGEVPRLFPLNGNPDVPQCAGVKGVVEAYHNSLKNVKLMDTSQFAPMISHVADMAAKAKDWRLHKQYFVLFLLTDGNIADMKEMKKAAIAASHLPMSIIVVGVGETDYKLMWKLGIDYRHLDCDEKNPDRNIIQFMSYTYYWTRGAILAGARLTDIPSQFEDYMKLHKIHPDQKTDINN